MQAKISKRTVDAVHEGERDAFVWDTELKGFGLKVTPAGSKIYIVQYRMGGRDARVRRFTIGEHGSIGPAGPLTADRARDEAGKVLGRIANGIDPMREKRSVASEHAAYAEAPTLAQFADTYIARHAKPLKKPRTVEEDERNLKLHIKPALGKLKLADVTAADIAKFHASRSATPTNANRCLALLSHIFEKAERWGDRPTGSNPCRHIDLYDERKRDRFLTPAELTAVAEAINNAEAAKTEPVTGLNAIRLLMLTGCRLNEILPLEWDWIDTERACIRLPDSKTGKKVVPIGAPVLRLLSTLAREEGSPYVLPADRGKGHFVGIQRVWQRIRKAAGIGDVRLHDLRHSYASIAVASGDSLFLIGKVLGHRQSRTTDRYAHLKDDPLLAVADRTAMRIAEAMGLPSGREEPETPAANPDGERPTAEVVTLPRQRRKKPA